MTRRLPILSTSSLRTRRAPLQAAELLEQVGANIWQQTMGLERGLAYGAVYDRKSRFRALSHPDSGGAVSAMIGEGWSAAGSA